MSDLVERLRTLIPDGDGYNDEFARTLSEADEINQLHLDLARERASNRIDQRCVDRLQEELAAEKTTHEAWEQESLKVEAELRDEITQLKLALVRASAAK